MLAFAAAERDDIVMLQRQFPTAEGSMTSQSDGSPAKSVVFYNLFAKDAADVPRVAELVRDQLSRLDPEHQELRINMIGAITGISMLGLNATLAEKATSHHYEEGNEDVTLHDIWSYCQTAQPSQVVVYIHSKGSFHDSPQNARLRSYATAGAVSEECRQMPAECNICSSRMTPIPYPQCSGNMWASRCSYVSKLMDPKKLVDAMEATPDARRGKSWCVGRKRYTFEHWLHSHPDASPCDLDTNEEYMWGYRDIRLHLAKPEFEKVIKRAPRFDLDKFKSKYVSLPSSRICEGVGESQHERLVEYKSLYERSPPEDWWGWSFFKN